MRDELTGERYTYTGHREELVHSEMALPDETPPWLRTLVDGRTPAQASAALWNKVQAEATRANAIYAREIVIGLPTELNREQQVALMRDYVRAAFTSRGMVAGGFKGSSQQLCAPILAARQRPRPVFSSPGVFVARH